MFESKRCLLGVFILVAGLSFGEAIADDATPVPVRTTWYVGKIGAKRQVQLELHVPINAWSEPKKATGSYFDEALGRRVELSGTVKDGTLNLQEHTGEGGSRGGITGDIDPDDNHMLLAWWSADGAVKEPLNLEKIADDTPLTFTQGAKTTISCHRPEFLADAPLAKAVESQLRAETAAKFASETKFPADRWPKSVEDREFFRDENIVDTHIAYYCDLLISLRVHAYSDGGGAHGNEWIASRNFVLRGGKLHALKLRELFRPKSNYSSRLSKYCLSALRAEQASFVVDGSIKALSADQMKAFVLEPRGITITFSPHAVASFAEGAFDVTIPWKMISDIVGSDPLLNRWAATQKSHGDETDDHPQVAQYDNDF